MKSQSEPRKEMKERSARLKTWPVRALKFFIPFVAPNSAMNQVFVENFSMKLKQKQQRD
jgi:hypothetical protein